MIRVGAGKRFDCEEIRGADRCEEGGGKFDSLSREEQDLDVRIPRDLSVDSGEGGTTYLYRTW